MSADISPDSGVAESLSWSMEIRPHRGWLEVPVKEIWRYRDLWLLFVRRDFVAYFKQTVLGPLWFIVQPLMTTLMFTLVFKRIAGISTDGIPAIAFYLAGVTCWGYFSECFNKTSTTFTDNANLFGKVYFPRLITPLAISTSCLMQFGVQLVMLTCFVAYYWSQGLIEPQASVLLLPLLLLQLGAISMGLGLLFSSLTTKYRDLTFLLRFGVQLLMYVTPVIYPLSTIPEKYAGVIGLNPLAPILEAFRHGFLGHGAISTSGLVYSGCCAVVFLFCGVVAFNRTEATFMDTV